MSLNLFARGFVFFVAAFALAGCATTHLETPKLTIVRAGLNSADMFSQTVRIRLHVQNPNDHAFTVHGVDYLLSLEEDTFAQGISDTPFLVPAKGETDVDLDVHTSYISSVGRLVSRIDQKGNNTVSYVFEGRLLVDSSLGSKLRFKETGTVEIPIRR
jgi:LEA14-like dessication related protein